MSESFQASQWLAESWASAIWRASWQGSLAIVFALAACQLMRSAPAWTRCWLWRLVDVKFLIALGLLSPLRLPILPAGTLDEFAPRAVTAAAIPSEVLQPPAGTELSLLASEASVGSRIATQSSLIAAFATREVALVACFILWMAGVLIGLVSLGREWLRASRIQREPILTPSLLDAWRELSASYGLSSPPRLTSSPTVAVPLLMGMFQPTIVLPERALDSCSDRELRLILSHELGHVRRADLWWSWLPAVVQTLFFFHPLVWFAHRQWRLSREMACDELAIIRSNSRVTDYAKALLQVAVQGSERLRACRAFGTVSASESSISLKRRFVAMRHFRSPSRFRSVTYATLLVGAALVGIVPWRPVAQAQDAATSEAKKGTAKPPQKDAEIPKSFGENMGFEQQDNSTRPVAWGGGGKGYTLTLDGEEKHSGNLSGKIVSVGNGTFASYTQGIAANPLRGKRVSYKGFVKSEITDGRAGLWMRVDGGGRKVLSFDNMMDRPIQGSTTWKEYEVVLEVPESATGITFGFLMQGTGTIWGDDFNIKVVGEIGTGPRATGARESTFQLANGPVNADFETSNETDASPKVWGGGGKGYELTRDTDVAHAGEASGRISRKDTTGKFGTFTQAFAARDYVGKRIKYTGYLKTNDANATGLWLRVDRGSKAVSFDNMQNRPVRGTTEWTKYEVVLDVPEGSTRITCGFLLNGAGTVWGDDLKVEIVGTAGEGPDTTGIPIE